MLRFTFTLEAVLSSPVQSSANSKTPPGIPWISPPPPYCPLPRSGSLLGVDWTIAVSMTAFFLPVLPVRGTGPLVPTLSSVSGSVHWNGDPSSPHCQNSHSAAQNGPGVPGFLSGKGQSPPGDTPSLTRPDPVASNGVSYVSPLSSPGVGQMCFSRWVFGASSAATFLLTLSGLSSRASSLPVLGEVSA